MDSIRDKKLMVNTDSETSISSEERASIAYQTLVGFGEAGIRYCLWKSFDRLKDGIRGDTDFDILMDKDESELAFNYLRENGWLEVLSEPWRRFPAVHDFLRYDPQYKKFIHFHVHFKLVMGEKLVKSLCLPLEALYLETAVEEGGIFHAIPELELCVFILRLSLKVGWRDYARIIRRRNSRLIYQRLVPEFEHIKKRCDRAELERLLEHRSLSFVDRDLVLETFDDINSLNFNRRRQIKRFIAPYRRYGTVKRFLVHLQRARQKRSVGLGKTFPGKGVSFAVCGPDGSGKTTLVDGVEKILSEHFKVARFYMGGNNSSREGARWLFTTLLRKPFLGIRKLCRLLSFQQGAHFFERFYYGYKNYLIAREKYHRFQKSKVELEKGSIVLFERFPLFEDYGDGVSVSGSAYYKEKERKIYNEIFPPNIIFLLKVNSEVAIQRKPDHPSKVIRKKTAAFQHFIKINQNNCQLVGVDANISANVLLANTLVQINEKLGNDN